ncbi:MAG: type IX secretion system plug protein domain-containing protein [Bacteroidota bacterium]
MSLLKFKQKFPAYLYLLIISLMLPGCPPSDLTQATPRAPKKKLITQDHIYDDAIHTVQLYRTQYEESYPVIYKDAGGNLTLEFDEFMPDTQRESDFMVDLVHCDVDWRESFVLPISFYEGFSQDRIEDYRRAEFTRTPYVHYTYSFPQENEYFKMSGNYILKVYRSGNPNDLVLTRRFVVAEQRIGIRPTRMLAEKFERQQLTRIDFEINTAGLQIFSPQQDLKIRIVQNFRLDQPYTPGVPRFSRDNRHEYQVDLLRAFGGGNEFRQADIRSTRFYSRDMEDVEDLDSVYRVFLFPGDPFLRNNIGNRRDRNGGFFIEVQEWPENDYQADYVYTFFSLKRQEAFPVGEEVYVFGKLTDWQLKPQFRMKYNDELGQYEADVQLKQGVYDYQYLVGSAQGWKETAVEGRLAAPENFYTIMVYFRSPTDRSEQLIGYLPINYSE